MYAPYCAAHQYCDIATNSKRHFQIEVNIFSLKKTFVHVVRYHFRNCSPKSLYVNSTDPKCHLLATGVSLPFVCLCWRTYMDLWLGLARFESSSPAFCVVSVSAAILLIIQNLRLDFYYLYRCLDC